MAKLPIPNGQSEIQRRYVNNPEKGGDRKQSAKVAGRPPRGSSSAVVQTKAQKVKAWRDANPEAYAKQKREFAAKRKNAKEGR